MIWTILKQNIKISQLAVIFFSFLFGVSIIGAGVLFYRDQQLLLSKSNYWDSQYIAVNKRVSLIGTAAQALGKTRQATFSPDELDELRSQSFVADLTAFTPCSFNISASINLSSIQMSTLLFMEAVPDEWVDVVTEDWKWQVGDGFLPVIMPKQYLDLYNFSFAGTQGLPQISAATASTVPFIITIYDGHRHQQSFRAKVVGFSEKLNTILAPKTFVDWGNDIFGDDPNPTSGHLLLKAKSGEESQLLTYIHDKEYDINQASVDTSNAMSIMRMLTIILSVIGILIAILALILMIVSMQLLLHRNSDCIRNLALLGFSVREVASPYAIFVVIFFGLIGTLSSLAIAGFSGYLDAHLLEVNNITANGLPTALETTTISLLLGIVIILFTIIRSLRSIFRS